MRESPVLRSMCECTREYMGGYSSVYSLSVVSHMLEDLYLNYGMFKIREKQEQTV